MRARRLGKTVKVRPSYDCLAMSLRKCPSCGVSVKIENLERHIATVHPKFQSSAVLSEEERREVKQGARRSARPLRVRRSTVTIAAVAALAIAGLVVALPYLPGLPSVGGIHWHPHLTITINGQNAVIPASIGIDPALWNYHDLDAYGMQGMAPLHTHDATGTIHEESQVTRDYTLGDFFRIWGQSFDTQQVLGHAAVTGHQVWMIVDGNRVAPSYAVVLRDQMQIEIVCGPA